MLALPFLKGGVGVGRVSGQGRRPGTCQDSRPWPWLPARVGGCGGGRAQSVSTLSRHVRTRKMVNYAWPG